MAQKVTRIETDQVKSKRTRKKILFIFFHKKYLFKICVEQIKTLKGNEISILIGQYIDLLNKTNHESNTQLVDENENESINQFSQVL